MSLVAEERVHVAVPRAEIWSVFGNADALRRVLPGCETLAASAPGEFRGVLATRLQFLTIRADVTARIVDPQPPDRLRLEIDGRPRGLAGGFKAEIVIDLADAGDASPGGAPGAGTAVHYTLELTTSGRLATFGAPLIRDTFRRQVAGLIANLEREHGRDGAGDGSGGEAGRG